MDANSYIVDRGEAVNLARTVLEQPGDPEITNRGIVRLARAVLDMDEWISLHDGPNCLPEKPTMGMWDDFCTVYPVPFDQFERAAEIMLDGMRRDATEGKP